MFKRMLATILAGAMFLTAAPVDTLGDILKDDSVEAEESIGENTEENAEKSAEGNTEETGMEDESEVQTEPDSTDQTETETTNVSMEEKKEIITEDSTMETTEDSSDESGDESVTGSSAEVVEESTGSTEVEESQDVEEETTEEKSPQPSFEIAVPGVNISGIDFSSKELLIGTENSAVFTWDTEVVSEYNGVYLTRYQTVEQTRNAYTYYYGKAEFVCSNTTFIVSDQEETDGEVTETQTPTEDDSEEEESDDEESHLSGNDEGPDLSYLNTGDDALSNLNTMDAVRTPDGTIALIDTGVNDGVFVDTVSVIGESAVDDNGHGSRMYKAIREEYPDAKVLSIKAMGADGKGQASDIYAAIQYAIESKVDVINLSLTANSTEENSVVVRAIEEAIDKGITVVGAAGNNASNAKYFIPGCVEEAFIIGAANEKGDRLSDSNYGANVDYEVIAGSTSEAAARFSALYMRAQAEGKEITDYPNVLINYDRTDLSTDDYVLLYDSDDFTVSRAAQSKALSIKIGEKTYKINIPSYLVFPIYVNATNTSKYYGFAGYRNAASASAYLGSRTFNAAVGVQPTGSADEVTYASLTKNCGTYFNINNTVAGLPAGKFKDTYGSSATAHGASDVAIYGSNPDYNTTNTGWTENWYNNGYRVVTSDASDLYSFSVFCTESKDMSPRGAYGQLIMLPITTNNTRGYADYKVTTENGKTYVWVPYRTNEVDQNAYSGHSNWQNFVAGTYLKVPYTEDKDYYIGVYKKNDSGDAMQNVTFDVKVDGTEKAKALKTGSDGIAVYKVGTYTSAPKVEVQENWTNERFEPKSTGYYAVTVYESEADARSHAQDQKHTWTNERYEYYASIKKDGEKGITSTGFAGAYYGLYDTDDASKMTDDHLIAVFQMDKDGYASELSGPTTSTVAGHTCKARLSYTEEDGWRIKRTVDGHTQYFICMGKDDLTDKKMLTNTKFAYKELKAPDGYLKTEDPIPATITKTLSVPTTLTSSQIVKMVDEDWENNPTHIYLEKRSSNPSCTDGNPNYSLKGATYKVFKTNAEASAAESSKDYSKAVGTLTVDEKGNSQVLEVTDLMNVNSKTGKLETTKLYIVEFVTGKGYELDKTVHQLTVTAKNGKSNPATLKVTDTPVDDPIHVKVVKKTKNGNDAGVAGATFTAKYYAVSIDKAESFASLQNRKADRTETYTTGKDGTITIQDASEFFPLGYVTLEETSAPAGYLLDGATATAKGVSIPVKMCFRLTVDGNATDGYLPGCAYLVDDKGNYILGTDGNKIAAGGKDGASVALSVDYQEIPKRGDLKLEKRGESDEPLSGIRFEVKSEATGETHYLITDADGKVSTHNDYAAHSTDTNKYDNKNTAYDGKAGTWFSMVGDKNHTQNVTDDEGALPEGWYQVKEVDSQGYQKEEVIRVQVKDGQVVSVYDSNRDDKKTYITNVKLPTLVSDAAILLADGTLVKVASPEKDMTIRDHVSYTNLRFNTKFTLVGKLMEIGKDGALKEFATASKSFTTAKTYIRSMYECSGDLNLDFEHLDLTNAAGGGFVVFQYIYLGDEKSGYTSYKDMYADSNNDVVVFPLAHDDPKNDRQTVSFMGMLRVHKTLNIEGDTTGAIYEVKGVDNTDYSKQLTITKASETDGYSETLILPFGTYTVREVKAPATGEWVIDPKVYTVEMAPNSGTVTIDSELKGKASNATIESREIAKTFVTLTKTSAEPDFVEGNPNYSLSGAEYKLYAEKADADAALKSKDYTKALGTFVTDEQGNADIIEVTEAMKGADEKAFYVVESKAAKNYLRRAVVSETVVKKDNTRENPAKFEVTDEPVKIPVELLIEKVDQLSDSYNTAKGYSLAGAEFEIMISGDDITTIRKADDLTVNVKKNTLKVEENTKHFTAKIGDTLPIGYITVKETVGPEGFEKKGSVWHIGKRDVDVSDTITLVLYGTYDEDHTTFTPVVYDPDQAATAEELAAKGHAISDGASVTLIAQNTEFRGNVSLHKVDVSTGKPMEGVKFEVKNQETGEVHYIYTDKNGNATTKTEAYVNENYYDKVSDYDGTKATVWFSQGNDGVVPSKAGAGALPLGKYTVTEKRCKANKDFQMNPAQEVEITKDALFISIQTNEDGNFYNVPKPSFRTEAAVVLGANTYGKSVPAYASQTIQDSVIFSNLRVSTEYTLVARIMEIREDGNVIPFTQNGKAVVVRKRFTTREKTAEDKLDDCVDGTEVVRFKNLDFTGLEGRKFVIYEALYLGTETEGDGIQTRYADDLTEEDLFPMLHENPDDQDQQFYVPTVGTKANGTKKDGLLTVVDVISFTNLDTTLSYTAKGVLVDPDGKPVVVNGKCIAAEVDFTPKSKDGNVSVAFPAFDPYYMFGGQKNIEKSYKFIVFEEVYVNVTDENGRTMQILIGQHKDLKNAAQTVSDKERPTPQTGDSTPLTIFLGLFVLAMAGIGMIIWRKRKLKRNQ